jgi:hypothetical protein
MRAAGNGLYGKSVVFDPGDRGYRLTPSSPLQVPCLARYGNRVTSGHHEEVG